MRTRYTLATGWLVVLVSLAFVLNGGTGPTHARTADDLRSVLTVANAAVGQTGSSDLVDRMRQRQSSGNVVRVDVPTAAGSARGNIDRYIEVATAIDPKLGTILSNLCAEQGQDPVELERMIRSYGHNLVALAELKKSDPEFYAQKITELNLDAEVGRLARQLTLTREQYGADSPLVAQAQAHLRVVMRARLDLSIANRERSIRRLDAYVDRLRDRVAHDQANFDDELARQLDQITGELDAVTAALGR